jgi:carbon-monoxide dehydrogenase medium subunit
MENNEILVEIVVPTPLSGSAGSYLRHTTRMEMDIAVAGVASWMEIPSQDSIPTAVRIALGAVGPTPIRAHQAEDSLINKPLTSETVGTAAEKAAMEAKPISDLRGSTEYRQELIRVLTRRTFQNACKELGVQF